LEALARITVCDNGIGFTPEQCEASFEKLWGQQKKPTQTKKAFYPRQRGKRGYQSIQNWQKSSVGKPIRKIITFGHSVLPTREWFFYLRGSLLHFRIRGCKSCGMSKTLIDSLPSELGDLRLKAGLSIE
jgi:hypothetical protein